MCEQKKMMKEAGRRSAYSPVHATTVQVDPKAPYAWMTTSPRVPFLARRDVSVPHTTAQPSSKPASPAGCWCVVLARVYGLSRTVEVLGGEVGLGYTIEEKGNHKNMSFGGGI